MLRGNLPAKIDAQGRLKIPTAHRRVVADLYGPDFYVTSITGKNVLIYPMHEWEKIESRILEPPKMLPQKEKFLRNTAYFGQSASMDKQGRIVIQQRLRDSAQINQEGIDVIGKLNFLEVWNHDQFSHRIEQDPFTEADFQSLADLGI